MSWFLFALLSAFFAALTAVLAKIGIKNVDSNIATAIRTVVILLFTWGIVLAQGTYREVQHLSGFTLLFLILSGITTGLSWLFYFRALQLGPASQVTSIDKLSLVLTLLLAVLLLKEKLTISILIGILLMSAGAVIIGMGK